MSRQIRSQISVQCVEENIKKSYIANLEKYGDNQLAFTVNDMLVIIPMKALMEEVDFIFDNS